MKYSCPACHWPNLEEAPRGKSGGGSYEICPSCGFQPGVSDDDDGVTPATWRKVWIKRGMPWSSVGRPAPAGWNPGEQVKKRRPKK
jgi:hypothetical protein